MNCGWTSPSILILTGDESPLPSGKISMEEASWIASLSCFGGFHLNCFVLSKKTQRENHFRFNRKLFLWFYDQYIRAKKVLNCNGIPELGEFIDIIYIEKHLSKRKYLFLILDKLVTHLFRPKCVLFIRGKFLIHTNNLFQ